jgi:plasmid stabilization system protein ParE
MDYQVVFSPVARDDLRNIVRYISLDAPDRALTFARFLITHTKSLARFPERGRVVPEFGDNSIREIIAHSYRIVYRLDHSQHLIQVVRFWHAGRGIPFING